MLAHGARLGVAYRFLQADGAHLCGILLRLESHSA